MFTKASTIGALLFAWFCASASAQQFSFESSTISAQPGSDMVLKVYLSGTSVPVGGANFTVRIATTDGTKLDLDQATSTSPQQASGFLYAFAPGFERTGVTSGTINGSVAEFRGILYPPTGQTPTFVASSLVKIADITIPVAAGTGGQNVTIELVSATDSQIGLLGVSDVSGNSIVPVSATRPAGGTATIHIQTNILGGDLNADGSVTPQDAQIAFQCYLNGGTCPGGTPQPQAGDLCDTGNGIMPSDAQGIFNTFLGVSPVCQ